MGAPNEVLQNLFELLGKRNFQSFKASNHKPF
jgi:hypothetical protein